MTFHNILYLFINDECSVYVSSTGLEFLYIILVSLYTEKSLANLIQSGPLLQDLQYTGLYGMLLLFHQHVPAVKHEIIAFKYH